jgi:hypothetical protein
MGYPDKVARVQHQQSEVCLKEVTIVMYFVVPYGSWSMYRVGGKREKQSTKIQGINISCPNSCH